MEKAVSGKDIRKGLGELGIKSGDAVFFHSSLSSFGYVAGGADSVIDAVLEAVGSGGTAAVPTFTWGAFHDREKVVFDVLNTPSETGLVTEVFRKREQALRSLHVCHSVAALGLRAAELMGEGKRSFGRGSSFHAMYELGAWNLFMGAGFDSCTELHAAEEYCRVPYRYYRDFNGSLVILPGGETLASESVEFLRKPGYRNNFSKMEGIFRARKAVNELRIGNARLMNIRIRDVFDITRACMMEDIGFLLDDGSREKLYADTGIRPLKRRSCFGFYNRA